MKKLISIILATVLVFCVCSFSAFAENNYSQNKITDNLGYFADAQDETLVLAEIYLNCEDVDLDEIQKQAYIRCGYEPYSNFGFDVENYNSWSDEDKAKYEELSNLVKETRGEIIREQSLPKAQVFFENMGIDPVKEDNYIKYRDKYIFIFGNNITMCLTKSEILKAEDSEYVNRIIVDNPDNNYYVNYGKYPEGYNPPPTDSTPQQRVSTITITDNFGWNQMYVYAWDSTGQSIDGEYPGSQITNSKINSYGGEKQFVYDLPENAAGIIISNGSDSRSVEIVDFSVYDGYWFSGETNKLGHYKLTGYIVSEEPTLDPNATEPTYEDLPQPVEIGDVNGDYSLDIIDAVNIQKYAVDKLTFSEKQQQTGDYNKDGICDVLDSNAIQKALVNQ